MSTTFKYITKKHMGRMEPTYRRELDLLEKRREEVLAELEHMEARQAEILVATAEHLKIDTDGPFRGLHLEDNGDVHALYCSCAVCQADLNNVTVTEATQIMIERGFIHEEQAAVMLHQAREADKKFGSTIVH